MAKPCSIVVDGKKGTLKQEVYFIPQRERERLT